MNRQAAWALVLGGLFLFSQPSMAASGIQVSFQQQAAVLKSPPLLLNGRILVAADDLARLINGKLSSDKETVTVTLNGHSFTFRVNSSEVRTDRWQKIDQGAVRQGNIVYMPLRWICEQLGLQVTWNAAAHRVELDKKGETDTFVMVEMGTLSAEEKAFVNQAKMTTGIHRMGNLYVIARGAVPNPGYGIRIVKQEMSAEQLKVYVQLTSPEPGRMYPQVIAYPYVVGRAELAPYTTIQFIDVKTGKMLFQE
ncbi:stalk domain-containing protein [Brevibacillus sp. SYP-B805]|uniref:stalk domain-containing protein n=1 Tax=Brevibacillus sp. SYP-B805 TaxID=1578199 RepID=UPI001F49B512|nr:stalk domain-containing protein [Brevibacillus sp. SYP-B805]